ncbi:MAG: hypothetical protein KBT40_01795 [bacterium]|nr:hypothetical protein [Candidatus Minthenecus merdequi]
MKTKSLIIALMAGLFVFSGCKKDNDDDSYNWSKEFDRMMSIHLKSKEEAGKILSNAGYIAGEDGLTFKKTDSKTQDVYDFTLTAEGNQVTAIAFGVTTIDNSTSTLLDAVNFANLITHIGANYKAPNGDTYIFNHFSGNNGRISDFTELIQKINEVFIYESSTIWNGTGLYDFRIERSSKRMFVNIYPKN